MANTLEDLTLQTSARLYDTWLLGACKRLNADTAVRLLTATTLKLRQPFLPVGNADVVEQTGEGAAATEDPYKVGLTEASFVTFRSQQTVSNELLADSDVLALLAVNMAEAIAEAAQGYLLTRIGAGAVAGFRAVEAVNANGTPTAADIRQMLSGTGGAGITGLADKAFWNCAERKRLVMASHPGTQERYYAQVISAATGVANFAAHQLMTADRVPAPVFGVPWYTDEAMPLAGNAGAQPHVLAFDPSQVVLAEKGLVVSLDTESRMGFNQTVIHATYRAAGALMNPRAAFGLYLTAKPV
jgi:hypothetical protein